MRGSDLVREIYRSHWNRQTVRHGEQVLDVLQKQEFFQPSTPVIDLAAGPSPHVGIGLAQRLQEGSEIYFNDWRPDALSIHQHTYQEIKAEDPKATGKSHREYWLLGDPQKEPHLIQGKTVIAHTTIPRITNGEKLVIPDNEQRMKQTLDRLLKAKPKKLALYLPNAESSTPENAQLAARALDALGVKYTKHDNIASADFQPYQGSLIVIDNP